MCTGVKHLAEVVAMLEGPAEFAGYPPSPMPASLPPHSDSGCDFRDVRGQMTAKRGLLVAAAGGHNIHR